MKYFMLALMTTAIAFPMAARAEMTPEQKKEVEALVHQYILEHGEVLIESVNKYQAKQEQESDAKTAAKAKELLESLKNEKDMSIAGNPNGDITVVEFMDFNCGYCKKAFQEIQTLLKDDPNVKVVFYDMPILGPDSLESSKWTLAAKRQGKYFEYHSALMNHQGGKDESTYKKIGKDLGLDEAKLEKDKNSKEVEEEIKTHILKAQELGIQGTPGFLIEDKVFRGYIPYDVIRNTIKELRAAKKQ